MPKHAEDVRMDSANSPRPAAAAAAVILGILATLLDRKSAAAPAPWDLESPHRTDQILIVPKAGVSEQEVDRWSESHGTSTLRRHPRLDRIRVLKAPPGVPLLQTLQLLNADGVAEFVEPDYLQFAMRVPNDPDFVAGNTWGLQNTSARAPATGGDIDAPGAWDVITDASSVIVAIIDSGIRQTHQDLAANLWVNSGEIPGNGIDDDGDGIVDDIHGFNALTGGGNPADDIGHGTHVAGIIGAVGNNGLGIVGVAWKIRLMSLKFLDSTGEGPTSAAIDCIDYARAHGARLINASWGSSARSRSLQRAVARARDDGIILVSAAGNEGVNLDQNPLYPASYGASNVVSVAATTSSDTLASFSNYGITSVDLAAPGESIRSTWFTSDASYASESGTSMATPHVTGTLALLAAFCPSCEMGTLIDTVLSAVDPIPSLAGRVKSGGRLNAASALGRLALSSVIRPTLAAVARDDSSLLVRIQGAPGTSWTLEGSGDLTTWTPVATVTTDADGVAETSFSTQSQSLRLFRANRASD